MLSMTAWIGLGFIWLVLSCVVAAAITWTFQMRQPMHLGWSTWDENGRRKYGVVACFAFLWFGVFAIGCMLVNAVRMIRYSAEVFAWLDSWFL